MTYQLGFVLFFFFQAEEGIRVLTVTGVQTCALPILDRRSPRRPDRGREPPGTGHDVHGDAAAGGAAATIITRPIAFTWEPAPAARPERIEPSPRLSSFCNAASTSGVGCIRCISYAVTDRAPEDGPCSTP